MIMMVKLGKHIREYSQRNKSLQCTNVYSVTNSEGFIPSEDYFKKQVFSKDITNYKLVKKGMVAYNPSRINVGSVANLEHDEEVVISPLYVVFETDESIDSNFITYFLKSKIGEMQIRNLTSGSVRDSLKYSALEQIMIPNISIEKQLDLVKQLKLVERIIELKEKELEELDTLIKSRFVEMFDNISETVPVSYYVKSLTAGKSLAGEEECSNKVLKTGAVSYDYFDATQVKNLPIDHQPLSEHQIKDGDIIISRMNTSELVGAAAYVWEAPDKTFLPDRLWRANLHNNCNPIFVWQSLIQPSTKEQISRDASGTSGSMKNISKPGLLGIKVKLIPFEQQEIFASVVKQVYKLKVEVQKSLEETQLLFDSLMQKYFE